MSTSEEVREEQQPDPLESIENFEAAHQRMLSLAFATQRQPSVEGIVEVSNSVNDAIWELKPFALTNFFRDSGNELVVTASLGSVRNALMEIASQTENLNPAARGTIEFEEPDTEKAADKFLEIPDEDAESLTRQVCDAYRVFATNWGEIFLQSPQIVEYRFYLEKMQKRRERIASFGGTAIAAFAGTYLANKLQKRN